MKLVDFARSRNIEPATIHKYLERNPELKEHTSKQGKAVILDEYARQELDKVYPLPKPVTIINGIPEEEHRQVLTKLIDTGEELKEALVIITQLRETIAQLDKLELEAKHELALLEMKEEAARKDSEQARKESEELRAEINRLRNRNLIERILNK